MPEYRSKVIIIMGSDKDWKHAEKIVKELQKYDVDIELEVASAHKTPEYLLEKIREYNSLYDSENENIAIITVTGLSDALSGVVAANSYFPVFACPPDPERWGGGKIYSTLDTPPGVPVALLLNPKNVALAALKYLANKDPKLKKKVIREHEKIKKETHAKRDRVREAWRKSKGSIERMNEILYSE